MSDGEESLLANPQARSAALSAEVGGLRRSLGSGGDETLRNTNGVYMKLMNFPPV